MKLPVYNQEGKEVKKIELDKDVFDREVNQDVLYQVVLMYRANRRRGLASTKTRGEVSGGGVKPWRQKGTGRARVGSSRTPLWRKGGVTFGPHQRDYGFKVPKKIRAAALMSSINAKLKENNLLVLDDLKIDVPKTKEANRILLNLKLNNASAPSRKKKARRERLLFMLNEINTSLKLSFRNISFLGMVRASEVNAYDVLKAKRLIVTLDGLRVLIKRIKNINSAG